MKKYITLLIIVIGTYTSLFAQELLVQTMTMDESDQSAVTYERVDLNNVPCALVKVDVGLPDVVFNDDHVVGYVPYRDGVYWVHMASGAKHLRIAAKGYLPQTVTFNDYGISRLKSQQTYRLSLQEPEKPEREGPCSLKITSNPSVAKVVIDGEEVGMTPFFVPEFATGPHKIRLIRDGYVDYVFNRTLYQGYAEVVNAELHRQLPTKLICNVPNARLWIDDDPVPSAVEVTRMPTGKHSVKLKKEGYEEFLDTVEVGEDKENTFIFNMKKVFKIKNTEISLIYIAGGSFIREGKEVSLSGYHIGETEITQEQWMAVMNENPSKIKGEKLPVTNISWHDCQRFIDTLSILTGESFRLPGEDEWEFAAAGGIINKQYKYSGGDNLDELGWYIENSERSLHPVAEKKPNELGLYDMCGNVGEWCHDSYERESAPKGKNQPEVMASKVVRGGCRLDEARYCTTSFRNSFDPEYTGTVVGFRLAF